LEEGDDMSAKELDLEVSVNGEPLETNPFVQKIIAGTVTGMLSSLRGVEEIHEVVLKLKETS
jgi:hypothetical protein